MKSTISSVILSLGIALIGLSIIIGVSKILNNNRYVSVRGLAEREVMANKVITPLYFKVVGNDLNELYTEIKRKNKLIIDFLKERGIEDNEISVSAPNIVDLKADRYRTEPTPNRYNVTSVVTVSSTKVELVMDILKEQMELLKKGVALSSDDYMYQTIYEYTKLNELKPEMVEEATKNARETAEKFAYDSRSELGKIKTATQGLFSITDRDPNTPYIKRVRVVTSVEYFLKK